MRCAYHFAAIDAKLFRGHASAVPSEIPMVPVESSAISAVGYVAPNLFVQFKTGKLWRFRDVPAKLYFRMLAATSIGKFFGSEVRGKFKHKEVKPA